MLLENRARYHVERFRETNTGTWPAPLLESQKAIHPSPSGVDHGPGPDIKSITSQDIPNRGTRHST
jgi:hypothetical protein